MRARMLFLGAMTGACASALAYSDSDLDSEGNAYNDTSAYVQLMDLTRTEDSLFSRPETWSSGSVPGPGVKAYVSIHPLPDGTLKKGNEWQWGAAWAFRTAANDIFAADSLTIGPGTPLILKGYSSSDTSLRFFIHNLRLRPLAFMMAKGYSTAAFSLGGNAKAEGYSDTDDTDCLLTILSEVGEGEDPDYDNPAFIVPGRTGEDFILHNNLVGTEQAVFQTQGYVNDSYGHAEAGANPPALFLVGNNDAYQGTMRVGSDVRVLLGDSGFSTGEIDVDGSCLLYPDLGADISHSSLGTVATSGNLVPVSALVLEDGATIACAGMVTNHNGFVVDVIYQQKGKVKLDFGNVAPGDASLQLLQVTSGDALPDLSQFEIVNLPDAEDWTLEKRVVEGGEALYLTNPLLGDYARLVKDDAYGASTKDADPANYALYEGASFWSTGEAPHAGTTNFVGAGMSVFSPIDYGFYTAITSDPYNRSGEDALKFLGDQLIIGNGGSVAPETYGDAGYRRTSRFAIKIPDLVMMPGSQIRSGKNCGYGVFGAGTMTIKGTEKNPVYIWSGQTWDSTGNKVYLYFMNNLAGSGVLRVSGTAKGCEKPITTMEFDGDNDAFTGTLCAGDAAASCLEHAASGRYTLLFGPSGIKNGTLVVDSAELKLGLAGEDYCNKSYVPFKGLTLCDGATLLADTFANDNGGLGLSVSETFTQEGAIVVDVREATLTARRVKLLAVPVVAGTIDSSKVSVINNPNEGYEVKVTVNDGVQVLSLVNASIKTVVTVPDVKTRFVKVVALAAGDTFDADDYTVAGADMEEGAWRFVSRWEDGVEVVYVENLMCQDYTQYDVYMTHSDYNSYTPEGREVSSFTDGQNWSSGKPPEAGLSYATRNYYALHINEKGEYSFAGDSLTILSDAIPHNETIFRCDYTASIYCNDLRFLEGTGFQSYGSVISIDGVLRLYGSREWPCYIRYSNSNRCTINSTLKGGATRVFEARTSLQPGAVRFELALMGDTTGYAGTIVVSTNAVLCLGDYGLTNATVEFKTSAAGLTSLDSAKAAYIKALKLSEGVTIEAKTSTFGFQTPNFEQTGVAKLDFGEEALADTITVLTVPTSASLSTDNFSVVTPLEGYSLQVTTAEGWKSLIYTKFAPPPVKTEGAVILLK